MTPEQAFAFVESLVAFREGARGVIVPASPDAFNHLQGALGRQHVPFEVDLDDVQNSIAYGFLAGTRNYGSLGDVGKGLRRLHDLADYFIEAGTALKRGIVEPEEWFKGWQEEEDKRRRDKAAYDAEWAKKQGKGCDDQAADRG